MNMKIALATFLSAVSLNAHSMQFSSALGVTGQGGATARIALGLEWDKSWLESQVGHATGYWDVGYTYWQAGEEAGGRHAFSFAPVFVYEFEGGYLKPFVEAGVGVSVFSGTTAGDQKFGSAFNFEDRLGAGVKFGKTDKIGIRAIHYSNASIKEPNDGIESYSLFYSHEFE